MKKVKVFGLVICAGLLLSVIWGSIQYYSIQNIGENAQPEHADVIIILGAGVWEHGPSPAMQARVDHALEIYRQGYSERFIVSGGLGDFPPTEAEVMRTLLLENNVPIEHITLDMSSTNTLENLQYSNIIMEQHEWASAIIVTDAFHIKRALKVASDLKMTVSAAPVKNSVLYTNKNLKTKYTIREVLAIVKYNIHKLSGW